MRIVDILGSRFLIALAPEEVFRDPSANSYIRANAEKSAFDHFIFYTHALKFPANPTKKNQDLERRDAQNSRGFAFCCSSVSHTPAKAARQWRAGEWFKGK